jgi:predicted  nucleic acid-binding Zn-ribbon protein
MWVLTFAVTLIGFITVWFRIGNSQGRQEKTLETLTDRVKKNEDDIIELKREHADMRVSFAAFMGKIEAKLDSIREAIAELKGKGERRAEEK